MQTVLTPLDYGFIYHIFSRRNYQEDAFREARDYALFLSLYVKHISPIADTYAYCLLKDHFHLLVRIKDKKNLDENLTGLQDLSGLRAYSPTQSFLNLFSAYTKGMNKAYHRTGALFQIPFGATPVPDDHRYVFRHISRIHQNSETHRLVKSFRDWPHSSYYAKVSLRSKQPNRLSAYPQNKILEPFVTFEPRPICMEDIVTSLYANDLD